MSSYLQDTNVLDKTLTSAVARAIKAEKEREQKFEQKPRSCRINKMDAEISCECKQQNNQQTNSNNEVLLAELQNIREGVEEVKTVKADIAELKTRIYLQENK